MSRAMGEGDQARLSQLLQARSSLEDIELPDDPVTIQHVACPRVHCTVYIAGGHQELGDTFSESDAKSLR